MYKFCNFFLFVLAFFYQGSVLSQVERIEPPNWWVGMKNPKVEIMLTGKGIGDLQPELKYKGVKIDKTTKGSNNHLFIDLSLKPNAKPGKLVISLKQGGSVVDTIQYPILTREPGSAQREGFNTSDVMYLITPDRFANGDPDNDKVEGMADGLSRQDKIGRHGGDLEGISQRLEYIKDLGFSALWLNPVLENNMPRVSYHGYSTTDFYKVDPRLGSNESYRHLTKEAAGKGIKMIMDMITNHIGLQHPWMSDPPAPDWINYYQQPFVQTNHRKTISTDPYAAPEDAERLTKGWFVASMPDLNVTNPHLGTYLIQNAIWWIEYTGLAGIRLDTYLYPDESYMAQWAKAIMTEYPNFNIVGEVMHDNPSVVAYWQKGKKNPNSYESNLPALFDFPLRTALINALTKPDTWEDSWLHLYEMIAQDYQYPDPMQMVVFADNHDLDRIFTMLDKDIAKMQMAMAYVFTTRGIPQVFYGTEILMANEVRRDDGIIRSDFPGGWKGDPVNAFTGAGLSMQQKEMQSFIKTVLQWRKNATVIHSGKMTHYTPEKGVYVYFRHNESDKVMVILNKNEKPVELDLARFQRILEGSSKAREIISGDAINPKGKLRLEKPGAMIVELE